MKDVIRRNCCQPFSEALTAAAFYTGKRGRKEKHSELKELPEKESSIYLQRFSNTKLQKLFSKRELPACLNKRAVVGIYPAVCGELR